MWHSTSQGADLPEITQNGNPDPGTGTTDLTGREGQRTEAVRLTIALRKFERGTKGWYYFNWNIY